MGHRPFEMQQLDQNNETYRLEVWGWWDLHGLDGARGCRVGEAKAKLGQVVHGQVAAVISRRHQADQGFKQLEETGEIVQTQQRLPTYRNVSASWRSANTSLESADSAQLRNVLTQVCHQAREARVRISNSGNGRTAQKYAHVGDRGRHEGRVDRGGCETDVDHFTAQRHTKRSPWIQRLAAVHGTASSRPRQCERTYKLASAEDPSATTNPWMSVVMPVVSTAIPTGDALCPTSDLLHMQEAT